MNAAVNPEVGVPASGRRRSPVIWVVLGLLFLVILFLGAGACSTYNRMVTLNEKVDEAWANIESQLKRRSDLIPNLVATVKAFAKQEKEVLIGVTRARARLDNAEGVADVAAASSDLSNALARLMVVVEAYPQLRSNENFLQLQAQLEGTENRINKARLDYNKIVKDYNTAIKRFPAKIFASWFGFEPRDFFEATEAERENPDVQELFEE